MAEFLSGGGFWLRLGLAGTAGFSGSQRAPAALSLPAFSDNRFCSLTPDGGGGCSGCGGGCSGGCCCCCCCSFSQSRFRLLMLPLLLRLASSCSSHESGDLWGEESVASVASSDGTGGGWLAGLPGGAVTTFRRRDLKSNLGPPSSLLVKLRMLDDSCIDSDIKSAFLPVGLSAPGWAGLAGAGEAGAGGVSLLPATGGTGFLPALSRRLSNSSLTDWTDGGLPGGAKFSEEEPGVSCEVGRFNCRSLVFSFSSATSCISTCRRPARWVLNASRGEGAGSEGGGPRSVSSPSTLGDRRIPIMDWLMIPPDVASTVWGAASVGPLSSLANGKSTEDEANESALLLVARQSTEFALSMVVFGDGCCRELDSLSVGWMFLINEFSSTLISWPRTKWSSSSPSGERPYCRIVTLSAEFARICELSGSMRDARPLPVVVASLGDRGCRFRWPCRRGLPEEQEDATEDPSRASPLGGISTSTSSSSSGGGGGGNSKSAKLGAGEFSRWLRPEGGWSTDRSWPARPFGPGDEVRWVEPSTAAEVERLRLTGGVLSPDGLTDWLDLRVADGLLSRGSSVRLFTAWRSREACPLAADEDTGDGLADDSSVSLASDGWLPSSSTPSGGSPVNPLWRSDSR